ncbi:MAG: hypothetical protein CBC47_09005 [Alphaproteobacteria bacterium TMED87]|nr:flagellin [Rhodospirillaceae bacterium]OUV07499.1 MAG: hypothetical protein CBC47_09005 [Alphaproteobacteria bacterium TMED87]
MPVINTNVGSLLGVVHVSRTEKALNEASERLSSGKKLTSAADDAAGLAISTRMTANIKSLNMAVKNANDGQAMVSSVEGALDEIGNMLLRMRELAVQSISDTNSGKDRQYLQEEINQLQTEITSIATTSQFNGQNVLDGSLNSKVLQVGPNGGQTVSFSVDSVAASVLGAYTKTADARAAIAAAATPGANSTTNAEDLTINGTGTSKTIDVAAAASAKAVAAQINGVSSETGVTATAKTYAKVASGSATTATYSIKINGTSTGNFSISSGSVGDFVTKVNQISGTTGVSASADAANTFATLYSSTGEDITLENESTGTDLDVNAVNFDGTTAEGTQISLAAAAGNDATRVVGTIKLASSNSFSVTQAGTAALGYATSGSGSLQAVANVDIKTSAKASSALETIDGAIEKISSVRAGLGALQNRLDHTINNLTNVSTKTQEAVSRIVDADFAEETAKLTRAQILQQAGTAMLAQSNQSKQSVLALLA